MRCRHEAWDFEFVSVDVNKPLGNLSDDVSATVNITNVLSFSSVATVLRNKRFSLPFVAGSVSLFFTAYLLWFV